MDGVEIEDADDAAQGADDDAPCFSLQVLAGVPVTDTMQIIVALGAASLVALLDSGSTHNFISEAVAQRTGLPLHQRPRLTALVANGERVTRVGVICDALLTVKGAPFPANLFVMPLARYDVVLCTRWLGALGPIVWDIRRVTFHLHGRPICWTCVSASGPTTISATMASEPLLDALLDSFSTIFTEPTGLPLQRAHDHCITLKPGAQPVAVRPYRYPAAHKDELERQCATMIEQGIVRRSDSPFSSPVLLVKKAEGSWRFCVDYRALNTLTVKDAFPIPVGDELLDELHGARYFSKLDLRSGYHQVLMWPEDVHKTTFRTHDGLYEFLQDMGGSPSSPPRRARRAASPPPLHQAHKVCVRRLPWPRDLGSERGHGPGQGTDHHRLASPSFGLGGAGSPGMRGPLGACLVVWGAGRISNLGGLRRLSRPTPGVPARGQAGLRGGERCHVWPALRQATARPGCAACA
jgi:hypothetical protein